MVLTAKGSLYLTIARNEKFEPRLVHWKKHFLRLGTVAYTHLDVRRNRVALHLEAMKTFLDNCRTGAYGEVSWSKSYVAISWGIFQEATKKNPTRAYHEDILPELQRQWRRVQAEHSFKYCVSEQWSHWVAFTDNVWSFCLAAGCSKAKRRDPFSCVAALRELISQQFAYTADLHRKISELNQQIILQQRMITALAYRDAIENLSATTEGTNSTDKWKKFLSKMFKAVENGKIPEDNPFANLFDKEDMEKRYGFDYLQPMAKELFGVLSRTIHNYLPSKDHGQYLSKPDRIDPYVPLPGQFDPMMIDFMASMRPKYLSDDGSIDWKKERGRYPGQVVQIESVLQKYTDTSTMAPNLSSSSRGKQTAVPDRSSRGPTISSLQAENERDLFDELDSAVAKSTSKESMSDIFESDSGTEDSEDEEVEEEGDNGKMPQAE
ncbi:hypothetical protein BT63DRAFT_279673 [Microthyrium microscopicum]|uniref:Uncharacterized protein n=1 Tax=Microthyrium microscopicum TaxID=703497 RepID=A0A6A6UB35_9PEZI|nr:hypothetical protein BT63DRAFT_279673 [Microthyrium microscopicum]